MKTRFIFAILASALTVLVLNGVIYPLFYGDFLRNYSGMGVELWDKIQKPVEETNLPVTFLSMILIGSLVTSVVKWSQSTTFLKGIRSGVVLGLLMVGGVNMGLLATTNYYSYTSAFVDVFVGGLSIAVSCGVAAVVIGSGKKITAK